MTYQKSVSNEQVIAAYERLGSVWKVGAELGIHAQTVSNRLKQAGHATNKRWLSDGDLSRIRDYYEKTDPLSFDLSALAKELGRTRAVICRAAFAMGLTSRTRPDSAEQRNQLSERMKAQWKSKPHPRGMAGKKHSADVLSSMSIAAKKMWATHKAFEIGLMSPENRAARSIASSQRMEKILRTAPERIHTRAKGGKRPDLGDQYFRSSWEANYARYLNLLKRMGIVLSWQYEPKTFWFSGVKRGVVSYLPDFLVFFKGDDRGEYHEVKGWVVPKDRTKWARMKKYYPDVKLVVIDHAAYRSIKQKWASSIPNWESSQRKPDPAPRRKGKYVCTRHQLLAFSDPDGVE